MATLIAWETYITIKIYSQKIDLIDHQCDMQLYKWNVNHLIRDYKLMRRLYNHNQFYEISIKIKMENNWNGEIECNVRLKKRNR